MSRWKLGMILENTTILMTSKVYSLSKNYWDIGADPYEQET
jgi:hypothetical protein